jgi:SulP family sulfate permease
VPGPLVALLATTAVAQALGLDVATIGGRFGAIPSSLPIPRIPHIDPSMVSDLVSPAISIALLGAIESLLSAMVSDGMIGGRHRSNAELLGQGIANVVSPLFGGIPATGAIARTATNVKNGGRTPVAGIVHAAVLLVILLVAGKWAALIPLATLAGILLVVAYNMSEWHVFVGLLRAPKSDVLVLVTTFVLTVAVDLSVAIQAGVVLAALLFMRRMAEVTQVKAGRDIADYEGGDTLGDGVAELPPDVEEFEINGSFCFGAARKFSETLFARRTRPRIVILRMRHVLAMDATGLHALEEVAKGLRKRGSTLLLSGVHAQPLVAMERSGALERIGEDCVFATFAEAVDRANRSV